MDELRRGREEAQREEGKSMVVFPLPMIPLMLFTYETCTNPYIRAQHCIFSATSRCCTSRSGYERGLAGVSYERLIDEQVLSPPLSACS